MSKPEQIGAIAGAHGVAPARAVEVRTAPERVESLTLRPLLESDRAAFRAMLERSENAVSRWVPLRGDNESHDAFFDRQLRYTEEGDRAQSGCRRVGVLEDGTMAGVFCLNSISRGLSWEADAVWWVDSSLAGRGVATAGVRALLRHALDDLPAGLGLHGVHCGIEAGNDASVRVAEKCGFVHQPDKRSHLKVGDRWAMHEFYLATPRSVGLLPA